MSWFDLRILYSNVCGEDLLLLTWTRLIVIVALRGGPLMNSLRRPRCISEPLLIIIIDNIRESRGFQCCCHSSNDKENKQRVAAYKFLHFNI